MSHSIVLINLIPQAVSWSEIEYVIKKEVWHSDRLAGKT